MLGWWGAFGFSCALVFDVAFDLSVDRFGDGMLKSAFDDSKAQVFALESPRDLKEHFVESIEDYISDRCPFDRKHALEEIWEIEKDERFCVYSTDSPFDVPLHVLLETVENFNDDHGDRYKLKTATNIGSGVTRYIFAKESKPDDN